MGILREWLEAYKDRTAALRDAAMLVADALDRDAAEESAPEDRTDAPTGLSFDGWCEENGDTVANWEPLHWARSCLRGAEPGGDRDEARAILVDALLPRGLWTEDWMPA